MRPMRPTLTILLTLLLAGCAGYAPPELQRGQSVDLVTQRMGPPTARHALPGGGSRLEYARGPFGKHTYMIDVDPQGGVQSVQQVLTEASFATVQPGMTADELRFKLGRPTDRRSGGWQGGEVWSYRYDATFCQWFQVSVIGGRVRDAAYGPDPMCDINDDRAD